MVRSVWKGESVSKKGSMRNRVIWDRGLKILNTEVGQIYSVYNGKKFSELLIEEGMVGETFGNYVITRHMGVNIHAKKSKKNRKK